MKFFVLILLILIGVVNSAGLGETCDNSKDCTPSVCYNNTCVKCNYGNIDKVDNHCESPNSFVCYTNGNCDIRGIFTGETWWRDIITIGVAFFLVYFAAVGGLGGGAFTVPTMYVIGGFPFSSCPALSLTIIFGIGCGNFAFFILQRYSGDKKREKPKIDYEIALLVEPIILAGSTIGVFLNRIFPTWLTMSVFIIVVIVASIRTTWKGVTLFLDENDKKACKKLEKELLEEEKEEKKEEKEEEKEEEKKEEKEQELKEVEEKKEEEKEKEGEVNIEIKEEEKVDEKKDQEEPKEKKNILKSILSLVTDDPVIEAFKSGDILLGLKRIYKRFPLHVLFPLSVSWVLVIVSKLFLGSSTTPSLIGVRTCGVWYFVIYFITFVTLFVISYAFSLVFFFSRKGDVVPVEKKKPFLFIRLYQVIFKYNKYKQELKFDVKEKLKEKEEKVQKLWTPIKVFITPAIFVTSGLVAALVGIGGGMINNPVMYSLGIPPELVISTSCFLVFFTSSSTTVQYILSGVIKLDYLAVLFFVGLIISMFARFTQAFIEKVFGRRSPIVLICGISIFIGGIISMGVGIFNVVKGDETFGFANPCSV